MFFCSPPSIYLQTGRIYLPTYLPTNSEQSNHRPYLFLLFYKLGDVIEIHPS